MLTAEALAFVADLKRRFGARRDELLAAAGPAASEIAARARLDFLPETAEIRAATGRWRRRPADLRDRRVEITGPTDRKMTINALNSGAKVWLADLEDANTPHWAQRRRGPGQPARRRRRRPRLHQPRGQGVPAREQRRRRPAGHRRPPARLAPRREARPGRRRADRSAALVDFGLYFFHNARPSCSTAAAGPYFYLPKMESHLEARLWNDVFTLAAGRRSASRAARSARRC